MGMVENNKFCLELVMLTLKQWFLTEFSILTLKENVVAYGQCVWS